VSVRYSDSCNFVNFYRAAINFLGISEKKQQELKEEYDKHKADPKNIPCPRLRIPKFHFPLILALTTKQWTAPMSRAVIDEFECYAHRSPPPQQDSLIIYNPELGKGQTAHAKTKISDDNTQFRVVPCASKAEVKAIAAGIQNNNKKTPLRPSAATNQQNKSNSTNRTRKPKSKGKTNAAAVTIDHLSSSDGKEQSIASGRSSSEVPNIVRHRQKRKAEEVKVKLEMEEEEENRRTPLQWKKIISDNNETKETENAELKAQVESLMEQLREREEEIKQLKTKNEKERKRTRRTKSQLNEEATSNNIIESDGQVIWNQCLTLLSNAGGISRLTIFNDEWHANHPDAARLLWGYDSWMEAKLYVDVFFGEEVDVNYDPSANISVKTDGDLVLPHLTPFERCMACRMFFHVFAHEQIIALCFDRHRTRIGQILKECCLDMSSDYLSKEVPDRNIRLGMPRLVFVDGKDWLIAPKGNDTTVEKCTYSSKTEKPSARCLTFSTAGGLVFEWSPLFGGRGGEKTIIEFLSALGIEFAPIAEWENVANNDNINDEDAPFWTALDDAMTAEEFDDTIARLEEGDNLLTNGLLDDGVLITGQPTGLAKEGLDENDVDTDEEGEDEEEVTKSGRHVFGLDDALECFDNMVKAKVVEKAQRESGSNKRPPILTPEILQEQNRKAMRNDPNRSGKRKLQQLERLQKLHLLYERAKLKKCLLSYYLLVTEKERLKLLRWMGSKLASHIEKPSLDEINKVPLRLAKIPQEFGVGADKGFVGIEYKLPNLNKVVTPVQVANSKKERLSKEQIESEVPLTSVRAPCETVFKRVDNEAVMKEKVPYWIIPWLPHGHALAHGEANLCRPLRFPGRNSIVGADYWDNVRNYTRIQQPTLVESDITTSMRQKCRKCKQGGIIEYCASCLKWYHSGCHNIGSCDPIAVNNPYM
jgi:hypothetical protein